MKSGMVFDIQEFSVHDGPGIRLTVFLKGCSLRCRWCHNPEGLSPEPQRLRGPGWDRLSGKMWTSSDLAARILGQAEILRESGGGVTFSGGEALNQADFVLETIAALNHRVHVLVDTSGYGDPDLFGRLVTAADLVFLGLKLADPEQHRRFTGADNLLIRRNLEQLKRMSTPFIARIALIPGVTDTDENLTALASWLSGSPSLERVDLLPYNRAAGAKYASAGMRFDPGYDEKRPVNANIRPFVEAGFETRVV